MACARCGTRRCAVRAGLRPGDDDDPTASRRSLARARRNPARSDPPGSVDRAIESAIAAKMRRPDRSARGPGVLERWLAWPLALAASIFAISFVVRQAPPQEIVPTVAAETLRDAAQTFLPVVSSAEIARAGDTYVDAGAAAANDAGPARTASRSGTSRRSRRHRAPGSCGRRRARIALRPLNCVRSLRGAFRCPRRPSRFA